MAEITKAEEKGSQAIASVCIHVERAIQRIRTYSIIPNEMPLTLYGSINQIWAYICLLSNLAPPLIDETLKQKAIALLFSLYSLALQYINYFFLIDSSVW